MIQNMLEKSRYLIVVAVVGAYLASAIVIIYSGFLLVRVCFELILHPHLIPESARQLVLECIEVLDAFLLGTAFFIVALGLYELFIRKTQTSLSWLRVRDLDDLKARLLGVIVVVMSVFFLEQVINWDGKRDILSLGIAEALMVGAITLAIRVHQREPDGTDKNREDGL